MYRSSEALQLTANPIWTATGPLNAGCGMTTNKALRRTRIRRELLFLSFRPHR